MKHMKKTNTFVIIIMTVIDVFLIGGLSSGRHEGQYFDESGNYCCSGNRGNSCGGLCRVFY